MDRSGRALTMRISVTPYPLPMKLSAGAGSGAGAGSKLGLPSGAEVGEWVGGGAAGKA